MNVLPLNEIKSEGIVRVSTGIFFLDRIFGTDGEMGDKYFQAGPAKGSLIMLAGEAGAGKSRLAIEIGTNINSRGGSVLTFQLEVSQSDYKSWTKDKVQNPEKFYVSPERNHRNQIEIIKSLKPDFVIVDSVNRYDVNYNGVADLIDELQSCARETGTIILMIGQLDKKGGKMMVRGSQDWTFLPDVVVNVYKDLKSEKEVLKEWMDRAKTIAAQHGVSISPAKKSQIEVAAKQSYVDYLVENRSVFVVGIHDKNRFGKTGGICKMKHTNEGVEAYHKIYTSEELEDKFD